MMLLLAASAVLGVWVLVYGVRKLLAGPQPLEVSQRWLEEHRVDKGGDRA